MVKKTQVTFSKTNKLLLLVIAALILALIAVMVVRPNYTDNDSKETRSVVNLGAYEYDFSSGKAVKRSDEQVAKLRSLLEADGEKNLKLGCDVVYSNVIAVTDDRTQVLLSYGCDHPSARMFAVEKSGEWKMISPTNQFDNLGIPLCSYVEKNHIQKRIAPVCAKGKFGSTSLTYTAR